MTPSPVPSPRMRPNTGASRSEGTSVNRPARQAGMDPPPPQPPPLPPQDPATSQLLAQFEERHRQSMAEFLQGISTHLSAQAPPRASRSPLSDFQRTQPPKFSSTADPLEADDWLRTMDKKLEIARVVETSKVTYATHYLEGPAATWWDNLNDMGFGRHITAWPEFKEIGRAHV